MLICCDGPPSDKRRHDPVLLDQFAFVDDSGRYLGCNATLTKSSGEGEFVNVRFAPCPQCGFSPQVRPSALAELVERAAAADVELRLRFVEMAARRSAF